MKTYSITIKDGNDISNNWTVSATSKLKALCAVLETWNEKSYGMPYNIEKDGITSVEIHELDMRYTVVN